MSRFILLLACFFVLSNTIYAKTDSCSNNQCIAVIDAGSSGSRLHVYSYELDETKSPININEIWSKKVKPGFAALDANQNTIDAYLTILFSGAPAHHIPVYFYATAGMRLVPQTKQKIYYQELQQWFAQHSEWQLIEFKTITGNEEALYDWLSVNYHLGTLKSKSRHPIGVMDIGGASVQIAFPIHETPNMSPNLTQESPVDVTVYGQHIKLFVQSFLGLGQNEMSHQFLNSASCFAYDYPLPDGKSGQGNATTCAQEVSSLLNGVHHISSMVQPVLATNPVDSWYAIGGIANLASSKPFRFQNNQLTNQDLIQQANSQMCQQQWETLNYQYPNDEFVYAYCLFSAYYYALMVDGYGITPDQTVNFFTPEQNLDWTLGVVLQKHLSRPN